MRIAFVLYDQMTALDIDLEGRTAWAQTGLTAGAYTVQVGEHGLVTGFGDTGSVGINYEVGVIAAVRTDRTGRVDNRQVRALGKIDTAYEVGGFVGIGKTGVITSDYDTLTARVAYIHDVSGTHDSYVITPQVNYTTPLSVAVVLTGLALLRSGDLSAVDVEPLPGEV